MRKTLNENGYEVAIENPKFEIFKNEELEQLIILIPSFNYNDAMSNLIDEIKKFKYNKKTLAFIEKIDEEDKMEVLNDMCYYMKIEGYKKELIPRKVNKKIKFQDVESEPKEGLFYNPYKNIRMNMENLLYEINNGCDEIITYKYPKPLEMSDILYIRYFLNKKIEIMK